MLPICALPRVAAGLSGPSFHLTSNSPEAHLVEAFCGTRMVAASPGGAETRLIIKVVAAQADFRLVLFFIALSCVLWFENILLSYSIHRKIPAKGTNNLQPGSLNFEGRGCIDLRA